MPGTQDDSNEIEYQGALGKIRARGRDPFLIIGIVAYGILGFMMWQHSATTEKAIISMVREMRLSTCISATPEVSREAQYSNPSSFCNRMAQ